MEEQLLKDLLATAQKYNYDWEIVMQKFPELADVDLQVLKDYAQTAKENNYDYEVVNPKFPELFSAAPVKKKDTSESLLEDGGSEQSVFEGDAQRPLQEIVDESPIVNGDDYRTQTGPTPCHLKTIDAADDYV